MRYDPDDLRSHDPADRVRFIKTVMVPDSDALSHAFAKFARQNIGDPAAHSFFGRLELCRRDFHTSMTQILARMP